MKVLWKVRRRIVAQLDSAPVEQRAQLRAPLRGIDLLLLEVVENRVGGALRVRHVIQSLGAAEIVEVFAFLVEGRPRIGGVAEHERPWGY